MIEVVLLCVFIITIAVSIINVIVFSVRWITHNKQMSTRKYDMKSVLDRWEIAEKLFQKDTRPEVTEIADPVTPSKLEPFKYGKFRLVVDKLPLSVSRYLNTRITLQDVQDHIKQYPPQSHSIVECTGCHIACKDGCDHTCSGKCSTACNGSCHFACVGVCGGGCSGEATAIGANMF